MHACRWLAALLVRGSQEPIEAEHIPPVPADHEAARHAVPLQAAFEMERENTTPERRAEALGGKDIRLLVCATWKLFGTTSLFLNVLMVIGLP